MRKGFPFFILNFEKIIGTNLLGDETLKDIFELRLILEMGMADLLFARKTADDLLELAKIVKKKKKKNFLILLYLVWNMKYFFMVNYMRCPVTAH